MQSSQHEKKGFIMSINYQLLYNQGYEAGQRLYASSPNYRLAELRHIAEREAAKQGLSLILRVHFKDGFLAGYGPQQEGKAKQ